MILGFLMFFVGGIFIINALALMGKVDMKEAGGWNLAIGILMFIMAIYGIVTNVMGAITMWWAAQILLFGFTYLMLGVNTFLNRDNRGLGWYCLWVAVVTPYAAYQTFAAGDYRLGMIWLVWGFAWFLFWLLMGLQKAKVLKLASWVSLFAGIITAWIPGLLLMNNLW